MRQTELSLSGLERRRVNEFRSKGLHRAREFNRAHILAALDTKVSEQQIMEILNVGRTAIWRTRLAYLAGGLDFALHDEARSGKPKRYEVAAEAQVTALACSDLPRSAALDCGAADRSGSAPPADEDNQPGDDPADSKKTSSSPGAN